MQVEPRKLKELQDIMLRDYGAALSNEQANSLAESIIRLAVLARKHAERTTNSEFLQSGKDGVISESPGKQNWLKARCPATARDFSVDAANHPGPRPGVRRTSRN